MSVVENGGGTVNLLVLDNGGESADRYTAIDLASLNITRNMYENCLALNTDGLGVCMHTEVNADWVDKCINYPESDSDAVVAYTSLTIKTQICIDNAL